MFFFYRATCDDGFAVRFRDRQYKVFTKVCLYGEWSNPSASECEGIDEEVTVEENNFDVNGESCSYH